MSDQAAKLRELFRTALPPVPLEPAGPPMIVVSGGRAGVGATAVAVNLAAVLGDGGERVVLVDAAEVNPGVAQQAGVDLSRKPTIQNVIRGDCRAAAALVPGPAGVSLLASRANAEDELDYSRHAQQRLLAELQTLQQRASLLIVDAGKGMTPWVRRFWVRARLVLLVTTTEDAALLDSYAVMKRCTHDKSRANVRLLVNQCDRDRVASETQRRFSMACQRFLAHPVQALPALPRYESHNTLKADSVLRVWESPNTEFGHAMLWLGRAVGDVLQDTERNHKRELTRTVP